MNDKLKDIDPEVVDAIRNQVIKELDDRDAREKEKQRIEREKDKEAYLLHFPDSGKPCFPSFYESA